MTLPNFYVIVLCYAEKQTILVNCLEKLVQWIASFRTEKYGLRGPRFIQQELDDSSKAIMEFLKESAVKKE